MSSGFDRELWDRYAPFFAYEEDDVYPRDGAEDSFWTNLRLQRPGPCLELGAGHGRLAPVLARVGPLVGLEPSGAMLGLWPPRARRAATVVRALAEAVPFAGGCFDLVVFPYNGYHCILDRRARIAALRESTRVLDHDGLYCMEVCPFLAVRPEETAAVRYDRTASGGARLVEDVRQDLDRDHVVFHMEYSRGDGTGGRLVLRLARLSADRVLEEAAEAGMETLELWGDYDRSPWERGSPRLLLLARGEVRRAANSDAHGNRKVETG